MSEEEKREEIIEEKKAETEKPEAAERVPETAVKKPAQARERLRPKILPPEPDDPPDTFYKVMLVFTAFAAVLPRVWALGSRSFSVSEANLILQSADSYKRIIQLIGLGADKYVPYNLKYALVVRLWSWAGTGEWWMRSFSAICGILSIYIAWLAAREVLGRKSALAATMLTAICPFHIMFSRAVGFEALLFLLCALALLFFLKIYFGKASGWTFALYTLVMLLLINLHFISALPLIAFNVLFFIWRVRAQDDLPRWVASNVLLFAVCFLWWPEWKQMIFAAWTPGSQMLEFYHPALMTPTLTFQAMFVPVYFAFFFKLSHFFVGELVNNVFIFLAILPCIIVFHMLFMLGFREYKEGLKARIFCFMALGIIGAGAVFVSYSGVQPEVGLIPAYIIFNIVVAGGLYRFAGRKLRIAFFVTAVLLFWGGAIGFSGKEKTAPDWKHIAAGINDTNILHSPVIILDGWDSSALSLYTGSQRANVRAVFAEFAPFILTSNTFLQDEIVLPFNGDFDSYQDLIEKKIKNAGEAWIVFRAKELRDVPRMEAEMRWVDELKQNGRLDVTQTDYPDNKTVEAEGTRTGLKYEQISAVKVKLKKVPMNF